MDGWRVEFSGKDIAFERDIHRDFAMHVAAGFVRLIVVVVVIVVMIVVMVVVMVFGLRLGYRDRRRCA